MDINGYTFYTMTQDKKSVYQNSGVRVRAVVDDSHDDDDDTETDTYYGQTEEIWELDYVGLKVAMFRCRWVTNGKRAMRRTNMVMLVLVSGSLVTKTNRLSSPTMLSKCSMYLTLQRRTGLCLCLKKRIVGIENVVEEEEYNWFDKIPSFDTSYMPELFGTNKTPYLRRDHSEKIHIQKSRKKKQA
jgi:hypothetical protein